MRTDAVRFRPMLRSPLARFAAVLVFFLGLLIAPGSGLVHGFAHAEEAHHRAEHEAARRGLVDHHGESAGPASEVAVHDADEHRGHGHGRVDDGLRPRASTLAVVRPEPVAVLVVRVVDVRARADIPRAAFPRADPPTGPPPRLRAPPAA